ncbi:MAG: biotin synthase, partial [Brachymonas sp.]|nr:biotin synthase [Brachymonas sp.]
MPNSQPPSPFPIDPVASARWQARQPATSPWLHEEVAQRMQERLDAVLLQPQRWLHWQPQMGGVQAHAALAQRYPQAQNLQMPPQPEPPAESIDMLWANMALHTAANPVTLLLQWRSWLSPEGFLMFSLLGPNSLPELRDLYARKGWGPCCHAFTDMHDWGDLMLQVGFADAVMDVETITLTFASPQRLAVELREIGRNLSPERASITRGKGWLQQWYAAVAELAQDDGQIPLTFEIVYGHALASAGAGDGAACPVFSRHMAHS